MYSLDTIPVIPHIQQISFETFTYNYQMCDHICSCTHLNTTACTPNMHINLQEETSIHGSPNEIISGTPPLQQPKTNEEVKWRQMDIIYFLAKNGVPAAEKDSTGQSPSDKASTLDEISFLEGSMLLGIIMYNVPCSNAWLTGPICCTCCPIDILALMQAEGEDQTRARDQPKIQTPGTNEMMVLLISPMSGLFVYTFTLQDCHLFPLILDGKKPFSILLNGMYCYL